MPYAHSNETYEHSGGVYSPDRRFYDGFEDGDYTNNPSWTEYLVEGNGEALVVDRAAPDGGSKALRVRESDGGGSEYIIGWDAGYAGWDAAWSIKGQLYTHEVYLSDPFQTTAVLPYYKSGDRQLRVRLGHRDGDGNTVPFRIDGPLINNVQDTDQMSGWKTDTWYHYRVEHDGAGTYEGYCWEDGQGEPSSPNAKSTGSSPGTETRVGAILINGGDAEPDYAMDHAFMEWG